MNKSELIDDVARRTAVPKSTVAKVFGATLQSITDAVAAGDPVVVSGFGSFKRTVRAARSGRNPKTGETIPIPESRAPSFSAGATFKKIVNGK